MATCKTCGKHDKSKPESWTNWDCKMCVNDELRSVDGSYSPIEKRTVDHNRKAARNKE